MTRVSAIRTGITGAVLVTLLSRSAEANVGVPMLAVIWPLAWFAFIPVVLIEAAVAVRVLGVDKRAAVKISMTANLWSTIVGIPVTWLVLLLLELGVATFGSAINFRPGAVSTILIAPFLAPWFGPSVQGWMVYAAAAFLCIPLFISSALVEAWSARKSVSADQARRWAWRANFATYAPSMVALALATFVSMGTPDRRYSPRYHVPTTQERAGQQGVAADGGLVVSPRSEAPRPR